MELSLHSDMLTVRLTALQATTLFSLNNLSLYKQASTGKQLLRATSYSVPSVLAGDIDFVGGLLRFPSTHPATSLTDVNAQKLLQNPAEVTTLKGEKASSNSESSSGAERAHMSNLGKQEVPWYPRQSSLVNGDQWLIGDFMVRCSNGEPAYNDPLHSTHLYCPHTGMSSPVSVDLVLMVDGVKYNKTVSASNCEQYSITDTTNTISLNRMRTLMKLNATKPLPNGAMPFFCAIQMSNLPNLRRIDVQVRSIWKYGVIVRTSPYGVSVGQLGPLWTVDSLRALYGVPSEVTNSNPSNSQSVAEFLGEYYSEQDLQRWLSFMGVTTNTAVSVIGPNDETKPGGEATLDIQWMVGISANVRTVFWSLGDLHEGQEPFLEWLQDISNTPNAPLVHSVSYADEETTLTAEYMLRISVELMKAGVRGLTILFASGDDGVLGYTSRTAPVSQCASLPFQPQFPSSSPFATSVGGTVLHRDGGEAVATAVNASARITSGGGFSNYFPMPAYQSPAVTGYLQIFNQVPSSRFNASGRAYPDISGMAHNYVCLLDGALVPIDGTSASTPLVASFLTLINDKLLTMGRPPLGFVNPLLYQLSNSPLQPFKDVTIGDNGCNDSSACCTQGFQASPGWDAATGLGTPRFKQLYQAITGVPLS